MKGNKDFLRKRNRNNKHINKKKQYKAKDYTIDFNQKDENFKETDTNKDLVKIGKHWKAINKIEPKNTFGKIYIYEKENTLISVVENSLCIFDLNDLSLKNIIKQDEEKYQAFSVNQERRQIICSMSNSNIRVYDYDTLKCIKIVKLNKVIGKIIKIDLTFKFTAIVCSNNSIYVFDDNYNNVCIFSGHTGYVYDICFNPDKEKFMLYSGSEDNTIRIWDIILNKCISVLEGHDASIRHLTLTNDGKSLISVSLDNYIYVWKLANNSIIKKYNFNLTIESIYYFTRKYNNEIIPYLLIGCENGYIVEFNLKTGSNEYRYISYIEQSILDLNYSISNKRIYTLTSDQTFLYIDVDLINENIEKGKLLKLYPGYCQEILDIKILNENTFLFSSNDNTLKVYDLKNNSIQLLEGHTDFIMNITVKGNFICTASKDNTLILWYSGENGIKSLARFKGHTEAVNFSALILKKRYNLVSASKDQSIKIWDFSHIIENIDNQDSSIINIKQSINSLIAHDEEISTIRVSPNEKIIASGGYDKIIKVWNSELSLLSNLTGHKRAITDISFSRYAKILASSSTDKTIKLWNLSDYNCINTFEGHLSSVLRLQWVYYGTHIISAGADGLVKFWNIKSSECINTIDAHEGKIWAMDLIENDANKPEFITGGTDSKINYWKDVTSENELNELQQMEDKIMKQEQLRLLNDNKEFYQAMRLSLELNRKNDFIETVKNFILYRFNNNKKEEDHISMIINNRKIIDEDFQFKPINYKEKLRELIEDTEFKNILKSSTDKVLEIIRDNNIKANNFLFSNILLKIVLISANYENLLNNKNSLGLKNKGFKNIKKRKNEVHSIDYIENFEIIKAYSEKHSERINKEITRSYILEYIIQKMKIV